LSTVVPGLEVGRKNPGAGIRWNLADVLPATSGKIFQSTILERLEGMLIEFENSRPELTETLSRERFVSLLADYEAISRILAKLGSYSYMYFSQDTKSQEARTFKSRVEEIEAEAANRILFFELWWKSLPAEKSTALISSSGNYSYYLRHLILTKPYTLPEQVEQAIKLKDVTGKAVLLQLYHQVRDSFTYDVRVSGSVKKFSEEQVRDLFYSASRGEREAAYTAMLSRFEQNKDVLGEIYKSLVNDWRNEGIKLRKYSSPLSIRNMSNDVPDEAVSALLTSCKENASLFHRYFGFKARILDLPEMSRTDVYSPLPLEAVQTFSWAEAKELVLSSFESFDESFASLATNLFDQSHIDAEPREGKIGGAYCMSVTPEIIPYILMSFTGKPRSVSTLAHELGHAIHSQLSSKRNANQLTFEAPLPLAETASVFSELLLIDRLLSQANDQTRKSILVDLMNDSYATIIRQAFFVLFELEAHEKISEGITIDELSDVYYQNLHVQFGTSLVIPDGFKNEWLSIPHIYQSPFYCYSYAWGNLLVLALYSEFKKQGASKFAPRYIKLLSYGGSEQPEKILNEAGFDIRSRTFWQGGFDQLSQILAELEKF
jgi:oligoendopeptidase F